MEKSVPGKVWKVKIRLKPFPGCPNCPVHPGKDVFVSVPAGKGVRGTI